ncbi:hypothetical protein VITFI_CDS1286 [Vitreoscilla filiformis]|uniref:NUDIX hydrolase n=1 Tax=Vitreoscilla filiformis TaxID=63 RepID=A0A221KDE4_VITFI|nr:hypothetical protein [Vitreoscilla filiformis]ASM77064.1 hypothetical protein VITFI_CDS1286 [Vitreoscilla filiformis]
MSTTPSPAPHRAILCHFDGYSAALLFARWADGSLLWPVPLPADAVSADDIGVPNDGEALRQRVVAQLGVNDADVVCLPEFDEGFRGADGSEGRVHLLRFTTFEAPAAAIEPAGGTFRHLPALRGCDRGELALLREVFNLLVGGNARR